MAEDNYEFTIAKFLKEQKRLLALERERFEAEKFEILEPREKSSPKVELIRSSEESAKESKDLLNNQLTRGEFISENNSVYISGDECLSPSGNSESKQCPIEQLLDGHSNVLETCVSPAGADGHRRLLRRPLDARAECGKDDSTLERQQDEMEQWVSDTFYSYFPSFNKNQNEKKSMLSRARQADYQEYLKNVNHIANVIPQVMSKHQQYLEKFGHQTGQSPNEKGTNTTSPNQQPMGSSGNNNTATKSYLSPSVSFSPNQIPTIRKTLASDPPGSYMRKDTIDRRNRMLAEVGPSQFPIIASHSDTATNRASRKSLAATFIPTNERGTLLLDEESRRKLEYQKELIKQIEEKRKEVERLREKEKLEEEMLTSRLEQQLKTMQLEEELEREKIRSEKVRIANEQNHIRRLQLLSKLENDHKVFNPHDEQRKTLSENGKEVYIDHQHQQQQHQQQKTTANAKVYRYFSNSAQNEKPSSFTSSSISSELDYNSSSESAGQYERYQFCKKCRADIDRSFLPRAGLDHSRHYHHAQKHHQQQHKTTPKRAHKEDHCLNCHTRMERLCEKCDRVLKRSLKENLCTICQQALQNSRAQKEAQFELRRQRSKLLRSMEQFDDDYDNRPVTEVENPPHPASTSPPNPYKIIDIQYHESDNDHDLAVLNPVIVRNNYKKPYSLNIDKDSIFHPSKKTPEPKVSVNIRNGEVFVDNKLNPSAVKRPSSPPGVLAREDTDDPITDEMDERISKYVKHYNTLWMKRGMRKNNLISQKNAQFSSESLQNKPLLPSLSPAKVYVSDRADNLKSDAMKTTEKKWDIPAVERIKVSPGSPRVLTQLGAIRKQLQLEQLEMDKTFDKSY
ncbi:uncharacterized protein LOC129723137 isoform X3 [Wyeomyia smithii]|uniref:uncharacterized protein LOC129723137 isoform X3 n=1 Tax=Wyeomyia smithii TaxID=174621 RepID=UPI0024682005|nr:uncharacterized protein LOC129723137 isoform X3 [Wyeomyia smithii]